MRIVHVCCYGLFVFITCTSHAVGNETGLVVIRISDVDGKLVPARCWVDAGDKRWYEPMDEASVPYAKDRSVACPGTCRLEVPAGQVVIHVERGKEYLPVDLPFEVTANQTTIADITLTRWIDMPSEGWFSTDMHIHFGADDLPVLRLIALADDLHLLPAFTYWLNTSRLRRNGWPQWPQQWPDWGSSGERIKVDDRHLITRANIEIERIGGRGGDRSVSIGAPFFFQLKQPVHVPRYDPVYPPDAALLRIARSHSPQCVIDTDKPLWGENVVGVALGLFDTVQLCHNHYHRLQNIPVGWGMIEPLQDEERNLGEDELFVRTNQIYYRWLNCGFQLAASGGSAMGVMPVPLGYSRTYAQIDGLLSAESYWSAVRSGRTFATSGPIIGMNVDGRGIGAVIQRSSNDQRPAVVHYHLRSIESIDRLELIQNGAIVEQIDLSDSPVRANPFADQADAEHLDIQGEWSCDVNRSGWFALRAVYRTKQGLLRQAHTSPVYVVVSAKPIAFRKDARYMLRWIEKLREVSNLPDRYQTESDRREARRLLAEAREVYEHVIELAAHHWGD